MSDLRINIRIFWWHFQVSNTWKFTCTYNDYHKGFPDGIFRVYEWHPFIDSGVRNNKTNLEDNE